MSSGKKRTITFLTRSAFDVAVKSPFDSVGGTCPGVLNLKSTVECAALQEEIDTIRYYETFPQSGPLVIDYGKKLKSDPYRGPWYDPRKPDDEQVTVTDPVTGATVTTSNSNLPRRGR